MGAQCFHVGDLNADSRFGNSTPLRLSIRLKIFKSETKPAAKRIYGRQLEAIKTSVCKTVAVHIPMAR